MTTRAEFVAEARTWILTPWAHQGRTRDGCDCAGLLICVGQSLGLTEFDLRDYERLPDGEQMMALCREHLTQIEQPAMQPGDIVVMRFDVEPQHIGILGDYPYGGGLSLIHSNQRVGKVVEHRLDAVWRARVVAVFSVPGVE